MFFKFLSKNLIYLYISICYLIYIVIMFSNNNSDFFKLASKVEFNIVSIINFIINGMFYTSMIVGFINYTVFAFNNYKK